MATMRRAQVRRSAQVVLVALALVVVFANNFQTLEAFYHTTSSVSETEHTSIQSAINHRSASRQQPSSAQFAQTGLVSHKSPLNSRQFGDTINDIHIECNSDNIVVTLTTNQGFNGMIYPKGLSKNSTCMMEYHQLSSNITYYLPLKSCNTMSTDVEDGVEYFNTVMVQPHRRLVTNQGRGYHIRCRYQTKERTITNQEQQLSVNLTHSTPSVLGSATMPTCSMRIYSAQDLSHEVAAENVKIGDELHLVIALDDQDVYGMLVTNCLVRDGMNWGEQPLIDDRGCPVDEEIMPEFHYAANLTRASVTFQAHKFPYTSSVYYQCNVRLCFRESGCGHVPPNCKQQSSDKDNHYKSLARNEIGTAPASNRRQRRWLDGGELEAVASLGETLQKAAPRAGGEISIEVSSGLNVAETPEIEAASSAPLKSDNDPLMLASTNDDPQESRTAAQSAQDKQSEREFCLSLRKFAIIISLISLLLMTLTIIMIACMIQRRNKRRQLEEQMNSPYHHEPYTNRAYFRE